MAIECLLFEKIEFVLFEKIECLFFLYFVGKSSKVRLTGLAAANALGERLPMFVIGKNANPRCFKHITSLPCKYTNQKKSWMDSDIFIRWLKELDRKMVAEERKITMIVDNCPAHPNVEGLQAVELIFLPPNTTSKLQPMDQGVIRSLKAKYRSAVVRLYIHHIEIDKEIPKINILDAMKFLVQAWNRVSKDTILNCFKKAGISREAQSDSVEEIDDPFKSLQSDLDELQLLDQSLVPDGITAEDYADTDNNLVVSESALIDDEEILNQYRETLNVDVDYENEENAEEDEPVKKPSRCEIYTAMELLQKCSLFEEEEVAFKMRIHLDKFSLIYDESQKLKKKQSTIKNFFDKI